MPQSVLLSGRNSQQMTSLHHELELEYIHPKYLLGVHDKAVWKAQYTIKEWQLEVVYSYMDG